MTTSVDLSPCLSAFYRAPAATMSSFNLVLGRPPFRFPVGSHFNRSFAQLSVALAACPAHFHFDDCSAPGSFVFSFIVLFVIFSLHVTPSIFLSNLIWVDLILRPSVFVNVHASAAYRRVGITLFFKASGNFRFCRYWLSFWIFLMSLLLVVVLLHLHVCFGSVCQIPDYDIYYKELCYQDFHQREDNSWFFWTTNSIYRPWTQRDALHLSIYVYLNVYVYIHAGIYDYAELYKWSYVGIVWWLVW